MGKNVHVTHRKNGDWAVITAGSERAVSLHKTQAAALNEARPIAQANRSELVTHDRQNKIRDSDSYGRDPNPPKDTKH